MLRIWMFCAALAGCLFAGLVLPGRAQDQWVTIGPRSPFEIRDLALAPDWPRDRTILAIRGTDYHSADLVRTRDGGETWERLPPPAGDRSSNAGWLAWPGARIAFLASAVNQRGSTPPEVTLFRSGDDGDTWEQVWKGNASISRLLVSPTFATDNLLLLQAGRRVLRSGDAGRTWTPIAPVSDVGVDAAAFSPTFAVDRTVVIGVADFRPRAATVSSSSGAPDDSSGLMLSSDGGETWSRLSDPSRDGVPNRRIFAIVLSPSFAEDGTLFVVAGDARPASSSTEKASAALFRSTDRGQTWELIHDAVSFQSAIAPSPRFAEDRTILLVQRLAVPGSTEGRCVVRRSTDAGASWDAEQTVADRYFCPTVGIWQGPAGTVAVAALSVSYDLGATWQPIVSPRGSLIRSPTPSPDFLHDGTLYFGSDKDGVWAFGPGAQSATGRVSCTVPLAAEAAPFYDADPWMWDALGCPSTPPESARLTEYRSVVNGRDARAIWRGAVTIRYRLTTQADGSSRWTLSLVTPLPEVPDLVTTGTYQELEQGYVFVIPSAEGGRTEVLFLGGRIHGEWRAHEVPK